MQNNGKCKILITQKRRVIPLSFLLTTFDHLLSAICLCAWTLEPASLICPRSSSSDIRLASLSTNVALYLKTKQIYSTYDPEST